MEYQIASRAITDEEGHPHQYQYILLVDQIEGHRFAYENYGVCIREEGGSSARLPGITTSAMRMDELMSLLISHQVTPTTLPDIVADWT